MAPREIDNWHQTLPTKKYIYYPPKTVNAIKITSEFAICEANQVTTFIGRVLTKSFAIYHQADRCIVGKLMD